MQRIKLATSASMKTHSFSLLDAVRHLFRRLNSDCTLQASYGRNVVVVTYPPLLAKLYPHHVANLTLYGRLISKQAIINIKPKYHHDDDVGGYVVEFDVRDPGDYYLQVGVSWYFGYSDPGTDPEPICVSSHMSFSFVESDFHRSLVHGGEILRVSVGSAEERSEMVKGSFGHKKVVGLEGGVHQRLGHAKCESGDHPGRWLYMNRQLCAAPYCTGDRYATANAIDVVALRSL